MKIVHLCLCGSYNDNWGYQDNMIPKYNKKDGHDVTVITSIFINSIYNSGYEKVSPGQYCLKDGVKVIRIPFKRFLFWKISEKLRIYKGLYSYLDSEKPDLIFMHGIQFLDMLVVKSYVEQHPSCRLVADNHATYENSARNFFSREILHKFIFRKVIENSIDYIDKIFAITPNCKEFAKNIYQVPEKKLDLLYLGADTEKINFKLKDDIKVRIRENLNINSDDLVLITGGKLSEGKNIDMLLKVFKKIKLPNVKLVIFGEFPEVDRNSMMKAIKKDQRIRFLGWKKASDIYDLYLASDLAIFLGSQSALWQQAIGSGLPIILKRRKEIEYLDLGGNCFFLEHDNIDMVSEELSSLLKNQDKLNYMKKIAMTKGYETFSYEEISRRAIE